MPLTNTQYASIMRLYDDIKTANRRMQSDRYNEVTALCPDIVHENCQSAYRSRFIGHGY